MWASLQSAVLLIVVFSDFGSTIQTCQNGVKKFKIFDEEVNWFAALLNCSTQGMTLATFESREEQERLVSQLKRKSSNGQSYGYMSWWLGGSALHDTREYIWFSTGQNISYTNFWPGHLENRILANREDCLLLEAFGTWTYRWHYGVCTFEKKYICEYFQESE